MRRTRLAFNGLDRETGYAVRFEQTRQGLWCSKPNAFAALSLAPSLRTIRRHANESIHIHLDAAAEGGWPVPEPEWKETPDPLRYEQ